MSNSQNNTAENFKAVVGHPDQYAKAIANDPDVLKPLAFYQKDLATATKDGLTPQETKTLENLKSMYYKTLESEGVQYFESRLNSSDTTKLIAPDAADEIKKISKSMLTAEYVAEVRKLDPQATATYDATSKALHQAAGEGNALNAKQQQTLNQEALRVYAQQQTLNQEALQIYAIRTVTVDQSPSR